MLLDDLRKEAAELERALAEVRAKTPRGHRHESPYDDECENDCAVMGAKGALAVAVKQLRLSERAALKQGGQNARP